ncbi:MAG: DUF4831 family protein [Tannerellaceae bacterium]|jgi:hypothetical protein|nr:DUF4831 family protein [Tannerellaceae bacterium]
MKYLIFIFCILAAVSTEGQTRVTKKIASKANNYGITYSLPKTTLVVNVEVVKTTAKAGPFFRYAEKYLGVKNAAVTEDKVSYSLGKLHLENKGIPDPDNTYTVEFKAGTVAPYVYLTDDGRICTINAEYNPPAAALPPPESSSPTASAAGNSPGFTEELLMAGSVARQAEVAAKQIYRIRESRMNILTGEADNLPPDGEAMKLVIQQLEQQEKTLVALFTGTSERETGYYDVGITPYEATENEILFRFSDRLGIVDADDLSGAPVYLNLKSLEPPVAPEPEAAKNSKNAAKGIAYIVPGRALAEIYLNRKLLLKEETLVSQFGRIEYLAPTMFEDRKNPIKVYFAPETGSIKQIIQ